MNCCDYCGKQLSDLDYMTECGHIICGSICFQNNNLCPLCKKSTRFIKIGDPVNAFFNVCVGHNNN